ILPTLVHLLEIYYNANKDQLFILGNLVNDEEHSNVHYWGYEYNESVY
ncbi:hypothetical protein KSS87_007843, partial [Heliosperma pusillum]